LFLKFLVTWEHPSGKSAAAEVKADMERGKIKEFGQVVGTTRGYAVADVKDEAELYKLTEKYRSEYNVRFITVEPILALDDILKLLSG
jgi:hypothetical protein